MDIDALRVSHERTWNRLHDLTARRRLSGADIDELDRLYRLATSDLARIRTTDPASELIGPLSRDLASARGRLTGTPGVGLATVSRYFSVVLPRVLYGIRWAAVGVALVFSAIVALYVVHMETHPDLYAALGSPSRLRALAMSDFVQYYSQGTEAEFASSVWANNAWISALAVAGGITGAFPLYLLWSNALNTAVTASIVIHFGGVWHFFRYILPHGLPELTAVFLAIAAGLRIFWVMLVPGPRTRVEALGRCARQTATVVGGVTILLAVSGVLEGYVTPSELPDAVRVGLGALTVVAVWVYIFVVGRRAHMGVDDGDVEDAGYYQPVAG